MTVAKRQLGLGCLYFACHPNISANENSLFVRAGEKTAVFKSRQAAMSYKPIDDLTFLRIMEQLSYCKVPKSTLLYDLVGLVVHEKQPVNFSTSVFEHVCLSPCFVSIPVHLNRCNLYLNERI